MDKLLTKGLLDLSLDFLGSIESYLAKIVSDYKSSPFKNNER